jgi:hypothetical protein
MLACKLVGKFHAGAGGFEFRVRNMGIVRGGVHELWTLVGSMGQRELLEWMVRLIVFAPPHEALEHLATVRVENLPCL